MPFELLRSLVWMDYRLAVVFTVLCPLGLLIWAFVKNAQAISTLLIIYWRVASLLLITVYLLMTGNAVGLITGLMALLLIPLTLWFWADLNEEIEDQRGWLKLIFAAWRWATTLYCIGAILGQISTLSCVFSAVARASDRCQLWFQPAIGFGSIFHSDLGSTTVSNRLEFVAFIGLVFYGLYFLNFLTLRLSKKGRSATGF
ncbi:DUF3177 family protein [Lyngbya confervoides]|uniref:DUF3177 family protein n=1 Tax=Lyngbya confervoides BDU141951 TaxID=1574623 RepID=A0ABD4TA37_9CYAN|nr:DUF3177 family protein [Lyngbya confervoides]MCM1985238.1 DUF3177 family protein [Lyngbya confervoides BDU141951]